MVKPVLGEAEALRNAFAAEMSLPAPEETAQALRALAPQLGAAVCRLADKRRERRSVRLQALGLAGCSGMLIAVISMVCQYRIVLMAYPFIRGMALVIGMLVLAAVACLPIMVRKKEMNP